MAKKKESAAPAAGDRARVLVRFWDGDQWREPDSVVDASAGPLAEWAAQGVVDTHPDAVAYAESLKG